MSVPLLGRSAALGLHWLGLFFASAALGYYIGRLHAAIEERRERRRWERIARAADEARAKTLREWEAL